MKNLKNKSWTKVQTPNGDNNGSSTQVQTPNGNNNGSSTQVQTPNGNNNNGVGTSVPQKKYNNLAHIDMIGYYQFVTFRTFDSVDEFLKKLNEEKTDTKTKQYKIDKYLDKSQKGCYLNGDVLEYLKEFFLSYDHKLYEMISFCIMSNHVHLLFKQNKELSKIVKTLKGSSSKSINRLLNKSGTFWESGYYDKAIRDENHLLSTYEYIKNNPLKVGLGLDRFYGIYE